MMGNVIKTFFGGGFGARRGFGGSGFNGGGFGSGADFTPIPPPPETTVFFINTPPRQPNTLYLVLANGVIEADKIIFA